MEEAAQLIPLESIPAEGLEAIRSIYEQSFLPAEQVLFDHLVADARKTVEGQRRTFWGVRDQTAFIGLCYFIYYAPANLGYLEYIAVHPALRGQGHGRWLLQAALASYEEQARQAGRLRPEWIVWEVADPARAEGAEEKRNAERRIRFYQSFGAECLPVPILYPPIRAGEAELDYLLMVRSFPPGRVVTEAAAIELTTFCLQTMNGIAPDSPYFTQAIRQMRGAYPRG